MSALRSAIVVDINNNRPERMGSPQLEDGHVRIANELLDAILLFNFSGRQQKVLLAIIRKTYGYNKSEDEIGLTQFSKATGLENKHVSVVIGELEKMNVIFVSSGKYARLIKINKSYKQWVSLKEVSLNKGESLKEVSLKEVITYPQFRDEGIPNLGNTKDNSKDNTKDIDTADKKPSAISLKTWLEKIKVTGEKAIRSDDPIFEYAEKVGITDDMLRLSWFGFKRQNIDGNKRKVDWRAHFRNAVRGNWLRVWGIDAEGRAYLTTTGRQLAKEFDGVTA